MTLALFAKSRQSGTDTGLTALSVTAPRYGFLKISGDVEHPGIYQLNGKNMTYSAIKMAKPLCNLEESDSDKLLTDTIGPDDEIHIDCGSSKKGAFITIKPINSGYRLTLGIPLDINKAEISDLVQIPGIGPVMAANIMNYRQTNGDFKKIEDLIQVTGIGEKKLKQLTPYLNIPVSNKNFNAEQGIPRIY